MKNITIKFGASQIARTYDDSSTVNTVLADTLVKSVLGFGDNVSVSSAGITLSGSNVLTNGQTLVIANKANTKAGSITVKFGASQLVRDVNDGSTVNDIITNPLIKSVLGYGDNISVTINGVEVNNGTVVPSGAVLVVSNKANTKAGPVTIKFGASQLVRDLPAGTTVDGVLRDPLIKSVLGFGDNVAASINGINVNNGTVLPDGAVLVISNRANTKAIVA